MSTGIQPDNQTANRESDKANGDPRPLPVPKVKDRSDPASATTTDHRRHKRNWRKCQSWLNLLFAFLMTIATVFMAIATYDLTLLARGASDTTQTQLRAYVAPIAAEIRGNTIYMTVRNAGQTPAYKTRVDIIELPVITGAMSVKEGAYAMVASGQEIEVAHKIKPPLKGKVLVTVEYEDVFHQTRHGKFKFEQQARSPKLTLIAGSEK